MVFELILEQSCIKKVLVLCTVIVRPDIAVGSPYEVSRDASDNNTGAVYIYYGRGTQDGFISSSPDQVMKVVS